MMLWLGIPILFLGGTLLVPLFFRLQLSYDKHFDYQFKLFGFDLTPILKNWLILPELNFVEDFIFAKENTPSKEAENKTQATQASNSSSSTENTHSNKEEDLKAKTSAKSNESFAKKASQSKRPKPSNKASKKSTKYKFPFLMRSFLSPELHISMIKWLIKGMWMFYPVANPKWERVQVSFGFDNPYDTSQWQLKCIQFSPLIPIEKIELTPVWTHPHLSFVGTVRWRILPIVILFKSIVWILKFPYLILFKSLYLALRPQKWRAKHPIIRRAFDEL